MKKHFIQMAALLFTVAMLTVSASAASTNCNSLKDFLFHQLECSGIQLPNCPHEKPPVVEPEEPPVVTPEEPPVVTPEEPPVVTPEEPPVVTPEEPPVVTPEEPPVVTPEEPPVVTPEEPPVVTPPSNGNNSISAYEMQVINLVNDIRAENGLHALKANAELSNVARIKSQDMKDNNYFDHNSPTYGSPFDMLRTFGISYRSAGENIAYGYGSPQSVVDSWMNSEGHRANILNSGFTDLGVGYVSSGNYWTQLFMS